MKLLTNYTGSVTNTSKNNTLQPPLQLTPFSLKASAVMAVHRLSTIAPGISHIHFTFIQIFTHREKNSFRNSDVRDMCLLACCQPWSWGKIHTQQERTLSEKQYKFNLSYSWAKLMFTKDPKQQDAVWSFREGAKVLFTVELKRREIARYEEGLRGRTSAASHNASSIFRCSFCRQCRILLYSILLEKLRWDAAAAWGAISISTQTLPSTDWISNPLNQRGFHSLCFVVLLQSLYH